MRSAGASGRRLGHVVLITSMLLATAGVAKAQEVEWTKQFGSPGFDVVRANAVHGEALYALGAVAGPLPGQTYAGGGSDVFLRKYDLAGNEIWTRQFGTSGFDFPVAGPIGIDDTGVYVAGQTDGVFPGQTKAGAGFDLFVRRYDFNGNEIWTRQFGAPGGDAFTDGVFAARGGVFIVGSVTGALPGQAAGGSWDAFIRMYDFDGNEVWTHQFGSSGSEDLHAVGVDPTSGGTYASGSVTTLPDFLGDEDALVVKYDLAGNQVWIRQFGPVEPDRAAHAGGIAVRRGEVYVTGNTQGTFAGQTRAGGRDLFVRKYDPDGNEIWTRQFGTPGNDAVQFGTTADGRGVYLAGGVAGTLPGQTSAGSTDAFFRQYDPNGNDLFTIQFGTSGADNAPAIAVDGEAIYVGGRVGGALPDQTHAGGQDAFVSKFLKGE